MRRPTKKSRVALSDEWMSLNRTRKPIGTEGQLGRNHEYSFAGRWFLNVFANGRFYFAHPAIQTGANQVKSRSKRRSGDYSKMVFRGNKRAFGTRWALGPSFVYHPMVKRLAKRFSFPSGAATIRRKIGHSGNLHNLQTAGVQRTTPVPGT
jgi:hypothetical protein